MNQLSVEQIKGVGPKLAETLEQINIHTVEDLLYYFPNRYDHYEQKPLHELIHNEKVTIVGEVLQEPMVTFYGRKKSRLTVNIRVDGAVVKGVMFNRPFAKKHFVAGDTISVNGKWDQHRLQITIDQYKKGSMNADNPISPIYSSKGDIKNAQFQKIIKQTIQDYQEEISEFMPAPFLTKYKLPDRVTGFSEMHFPSSFQQLKHAKRRFIYEELLLFQIKMQLYRKRNREATEGNAQVINMEQVKQLIQQFPFTLTEAQKKSLTDIFQDLHSPYRMNRLLQGDVGSGKTAVAVISLYGTVTAGKQVAFMVPTEILAEQHEASLKELLPKEVTIHRLTGSIKGKKRQQILSEVEDGSCQVVIGTHALIQDDVHFRDLAYVIIDEQHRFGVHQRNTLREKGILADMLYMTATPIPRTLSITAFGDMDVSKIDEMPKGRKPVETYWVKQNMFERTVNFIYKEIKKGSQAYIICPLIEESDKLDIQNALDLFAQLQEVLQGKATVGLMHGRLSTEEKEQVMLDFASNNVQILVSTTVVEVGVNVPNATVMMIQDADRFGLSQLHQLRGRVGRGDKQSYCILVADPKGETGKERMRIMTETTDGFELAERDLELRGPGDLFGVKQSGLPEFKLADLVHDYRALETARTDAIELVEHQFWKDPDYQDLFNYLQKELDLDKQTLA
ncbi:ATP-dependent DNA helicase RecG [Gracilibacillus caseinilyticus]|uniref:ATP-dependent DNA helicase RecG n=1 Tax=Gracilibacillus caseinilyticus TaxID=2932256 RepID=A0ABY4EVK3_9BACI|nr:ATP-dependent DNA helicase RecG [Gracilibacillus caseinilyticus]UOQ47913.1 ATP-dependent DNA helicase RecG [Gracilibacillus caseinilyticus]